jgi:hypothetical protein
MATSYSLLALLPSVEQEEEAAKAKASTHDSAERTAAARKGWEEHQPYFVTKSHAYIMDESNPLNRTEFDKRHDKLVKTSVGDVWIGLR